MTHYTTVFFDLYGTLIDIHTEEDPDAAWTALRAALYQNGADYATNTQLRNEFRRQVVRANATRDIHTEEDPDAAWTALRAALYQNGADYATNTQLRNEFRRQVVRANATRTRTEWFEPDFLPAYRGLLEACWADDSLDHARKVAWAFRRAATTKFRLYPGVFDMLTQLRSAGLRVALVSNAQSCYTRPELELTGLGDVFDEVVISSDEGARKPSAELFRSALVRMNVEPEHVVMVGNDPRNDIDGARMANIDGIYLHGQHRRHLPAHRQSHVGAVRHRSLLARRRRLRGRARLHTTRQHGRRA